MQVDIQLFNVRAYNIDKVEVLLGQTFYLLTDAPEGTTWFFNNDEVLSLDVLEGERDAEIMADAEGTSTILFMDPSKRILKEVTVVVKNTIELPAAILEIISESPILK